MISATRNPATETIRKERADKAVGVTALAFLAIGLAVAFVTPDYILDHYSLARAFVEFMSFVPHVEKMGLIGPTPQKAKFFAAVMWFLAPAAFFFLIRGMWHVKDTSERIQYGHATKYLLTTIAMLVFVWIAWSPPIETRHMRLETGSVIGMGLFASLHVFCGPLLTSAVIVLLRNFRWLICGDKAARSTRVNQRNQRGQARIDLE